MSGSRHIRRGMSLAISSAVLWSFFFAATTGPVLAGLLVALDMNNVLIGLVNSMLLLFLPFQILGAIIQQRFFPRKKFWFSAIFTYYFSYFLLMILVIFWTKIDHRTAIAAFLIIFALAQMAVQLGTSVWFAWMGELIPPRESNNFWNKRAGMSQISLLIASISVGFIIDAMGRDSLATYASVIGGGVIFGFLSLFTQASVNDPGSRRTVSRIPALTRLRLTWRNESCRLLIIFFAIQSLFVWLAAPFIFVYLQKDLKFDMTTVQLLVGLSSIVSFFSGYAFRVLGAKFGRKPIVLICTALKGVEFICWGCLFQNSSWVAALPAFILGGFVNMGLTTSQFSLLTSVEHKKNQSFSIGVFFAVNGLASFASSSVSGVVYDWLGSFNFVSGTSLSPFNILSLVAAIGYFISILVFIKFPERGSVPTVEVVRVLLSNNPFRTLYHAHVLSKPMLEHSRVNTLDSAKGRLITNEIIADLHNPSSRVRESAVSNIARLRDNANPALEDELIKLLDMPELGLQVHAARALGHIKSSRALPALEHCLEDQDLTMSQSCVFALGMIGDARALKNLLNMLDSERLRLCRPQAAEAIGKLGDHRHTRKIFRLYSLEYNWTLKKQILIAAARTLADDHKHLIHPAFEQEEKTPGEVAERLINSIQAELAAKTPEHAGKQRFNAIADAIDCGCHADAARQLLTAMINTLQPLGTDFKLSDHDADSKLAGLLSSSGGIRHPALLKDTYDSVNFWLLVSLWAELRFRPDEFNRFENLTLILCASELVRHHSST